QMSTTDSGSVRGDRNLLWQQILSLDAKYNSFRFNKWSNFRVLYMRRRNQLFRELAQNETNVARKNYLKIRNSILNQKYGHLIETGSRKTVRSVTRVQTEDIQNFSADFANQLNLNIDLDVEKTLEAKESPLNEQYAFTGMHHIFDHHKNAVTRVHFANNDKSLLACCSLDGTLSICQLTPPPATVLYILKGHTDGVLDFEWSLSNDLIVSCSLDCTIRLWHTASGACLRIIRDPTFSAVITAAFQPINNNMIVIGNGKGYIHVINVSTGIVVKGGSLKTNTNCCVQCLCFDTSGRILWIGDSRGFVSSFLFELPSGRLLRLTKSHLMAGSCITSIFMKTVIQRETRNSYLLVNRYPNAVLVFAVDSQMRLDLIATLNVKHQNRSLMIRSVFCPISISKEGICIVSGSEDGDVYLFTDFEFYNNQMRNFRLSKLQGHSAPVLDVCFNFDESLLASSDLFGNVVVWRKDSNT
ncbi:hypothetical protein B4U79_05611, partial [Dinothrombium tinctorium]